jgi:hypothetical protein
VEKDGIEGWVGLGEEEKDLSALKDPPGMDTVEVGVAFGILVTTPVKDSMPEDERDMGGEKVALIKGDKVPANPGLPEPQRGLLDIDCVPPALVAEVDGTELVLGNGL